jgi:REP element-mobilizing transposase RayT
MRDLRKIQPNQPIEITCRIDQGRYLLRPDETLNSHILGVLGRAQRRENMKIHAFAVMSNHAHYILSPTSGDQLMRFMRYLQGNLAREVKILQKWTGSTVWARRYRSIQISDEDEAQIARLRYVLAHGVKENLVRRVRDWPGVHCARALLGEERLKGVWIDRTKLGELRRRGKSLEAATEFETVELSPLPCWQDLPEEEIENNVADLVEGIEREADERRAAEGSRVVGVRAILNAHPHLVPEELSWSPAPRFHAATRAARQVLRDAYIDFAARFREAAKLLREGAPSPGFPPGSFPPMLPFVPHEAPG